MKTSNVIEGLQILSKYYDGPGYNCGANHDVIYGYSTDRPVTPEDVKRLVELGWFQEEAEHDVGEGFKPENYDPEESWTAYV